METVLGSSKTLCGRGMNVSTFSVYNKLWIVNWAGHLLNMNGIKFYRLFFLSVCVERNTLELNARKVTGFNIVLQSLWREEIVRWVVTGAIGILTGLVRVNHHQQLHVRMCCKVCHQFNNYYYQ